jgi:hypothetical protein
MENNIYGNPKLVVEWLMGSRARRSINVHVSLPQVEDLKSTFTNNPIFIIFLLKFEYFMYMYKINCFSNFL